MKTFIVKFWLEHESYSGYNHRDGCREFTVEARNIDSAIKKAKKQVPNHQWVANSFIKEV